MTTATPPGGRLTGGSGLGVGAPGGIMSAAKLSQTVRGPGPAVLELGVREPAPYDPPSPRHVPAARPRAAVVRPAAGPDPARDRGDRAGPAVRVAQQARDPGPAGTADHGPGMAGRHRDRA